MIYHAYFARNCTFLIADLYKFCWISRAVIFCSYLFFAFSHARIIKSPIFAPLKGHIMPVTEQQLTIQITHNFNSIN